MSGPPSSSRVRALGVHAAGSVVVAAATARLYATGGYAVVPGDLLACPVHAVTGLWCPFCGGLRCVAALTHGDLGAAASANLVVVLLLPVVVAGWLLSLRATLRGTSAPRPVTNRQWLVLTVVLVAFTVWRNAPGLPYAAYLAP